MAQKLNVNTSIVDYLKSQRMDSSYTNRAKIAKQYGIKDYIGSGQQNTSLLSQLKGGSQVSKVPTIPKVPAKVATGTIIPAVVPPKANGFNPINSIGKGIIPGVQSAISNLPTIPAASNIPAASPYGNAPEAYNSQRSTQIDSILNNLLNGQSFNYNMNADPLYNQYNQQYTRQADLGMRDTMGNTSALTGGYGSSYGTTAGSQAYDAQMQQLNDRVPELYNLAMEKYQNDINNQRNNLSALQGLDQQEYSQYRDKVGDFQTDRGFNYGVDYDAKQQANRDQEFNYGVGQDTINQNNIDRTFNYGAGQDVINQNNINRNFNYGVTQDTQQQANRNQEFNYGVTQDTQQQNNRNQEFNYGVGQDKQAQQNYNNETAYNRSQDTLDRQDYKSETAYQHALDAQGQKNIDADRQDAIDQYITEQSQTQSNSEIKESTARIETYSSKVDKMMSETIEEIEGLKTPKYSIDDVWKFLKESGLTYDEIAIVVSGNYELQKDYDSNVNN